MNKVKELSWWLEFAQSSYTDEEFYYDPKAEQWLAEIDAMINRPGEFAGWLAPKVTPEELYDIQCDAQNAVYRLLKGKPFDAEYVVRVGVNKKGKFETWIDPKQPRLGAAMLAKAFGLAQIKPDRLKTCDCGKIFVQAGKKEKLYCGATCRKRASLKRRK